MIFLDIHTLSCEFRGHRAGFRGQELASRYSPHILKDMAKINDNSKECESLSRQLKEQREDGTDSLVEDGKKMSERQTKAGNQITFSLSHSHSLSLCHSLTLVILNNFCFHVYAQKSLSHSQVPQTTKLNSKT